MPEFLLSRRSTRPIRVLSLLLGCTALAALPPAARAQSADETLVLDPILVQGAASDGTSLAAATTSGASRMETDMLDTAASISVITSAEIERRGATSIEEVLQYTPGVSTDFYGSDDRFDYFLIRGFDAYTYRDGLRLGFGENFGGIREEPFAFERVEVLKGANSTTFGISDPGGMVNYVSKTPKTGRWGEGYVQAGSFEAKEIGADFGDDLIEGGRLSYRVTAKLRDADAEYDYSRDDERFAMIGLTWRPSNATELTFLLDYLDRDGVPGGTGHPSGTNFDRSTFFGEPDFNYRGTERTSATLMASHDFGNGLTLGSTLRWSDADSDFGYVYLNGTAAPTTAYRYYFANETDEETLIGDVHLQYDMDLGWAKSRTLAGVDASQGDRRATNWWAGADPIDWTDVHYAGGIDLDDLTPYQDLRTEQETRAVYAQQELTFADRVILSGGVRQDWFDITRTDYLAGTKESDDFDATTARLALTYKITPQLSVYGSYAESVVPAGLEIAPERGEQYEIGVKYRPAGTSSILSAALYDLTKTNITVTNPNTYVQETVGEVEVRGLDLEAKVDLVRGFDVIAGYSWIDSEIVENGTGGNEGNQLGFVPEQTASLWVNYTLDGRGPRGDMTFGLGMRYTGDYYATNDNEIEVGAYTIYDASFSYDLAENTSLGVTVSNLLDEKVLVWEGGGANFYNPSREVAVTLRRRW
ncbi:TonB-dependent siderophore receptor [Poseidonocella sp. HB161398]|uniref:TonB-dependent siderophore receptor n=1 Tax=Poseidonocella sp. HB161398 TaxID=2320855 RepID=UPI0011094D0F|nr:TonB-dependent siderophore receptor [Poseidonocella sp. HB161398]